MNPPVPMSIYSDNIVCSRTEIQHGLRLPATEVAFPPALVPSRVASAAAALTPSWDKMNGMLSDRSSFMDQLLTLEYVA